MSNKERRDNPWRAAGLVGALGLEFAVLLVGGYITGSFFARQWGGSQVWAVVGLLIGLAVGILSAVLMVKKLLEDADG